MPHAAQTVRKTRLRVGGATRENLTNQKEKVMNFSLRQAFYAASASISTLGWVGLTRGHHPGEALIAGAAIGACVILAGISSRPSP